MTAEEAALIMMSGGGGDIVTTDIISRITALPVLCGGGVGKSYHYLLHCGSVENGINSHISYHTETNKGGKNVYYVDEYNESVNLWFVLYKNADNRVIGATTVNTNLGATYSGYFSKKHKFSTRFKNIPPDPQDTVEIEDYPVFLRERHFLGAEAAITKQDNRQLTFFFTVHYTDLLTNYLMYITDEDGNVVGVPPKYTVKSQETYTNEFNTQSVYLPFYSTNSAFYSSLSADEMNAEMVNLTYEISETTN